MFVIWLIINRNGRKNGEEHVVKMLLRPVLQLNISHLINHRVKREKREIKRNENRIFNIVAWYLCFPVILSRNVKYRSRLFASLISTWSLLKIKNCPQFASGNCEITFKFSRAGNHECKYFTNNF